MIRFSIRVLMVIPALYLGFLFALFGAALVSGAGSAAVKATMVLLPPSVAFLVLLPAERVRTAALLAGVTWSFVVAALVWADSSTGGFRRRDMRENVPIGAATLLGAVSAATAARMLDRRERVVPRTTPPAGS